MLFSLSLFCCPSLSARIYIGRVVETGSVEERRAPLFSVWNDSSERFRAPGSGTYIGAFAASGFDKSRRVSLTAGPGHAASLASRTLARNRTREIQTSVGLALILSFSSILHPSFCLPLSLGNSCASSIGMNGRGGAQGEHENLLCALSVPPPVRDSFTPYLLDV